MSALRLVHTTHHTTTPLEQPTGCDEFRAREALVQRVFARWVVLHREGRPVQPRLTEQRRQAVVMALGWGFDEAAIEMAIDGCKASWFCQAGNRTGHPLDELTWILGSAERIERLANEGAVAREAIEQRQAAVRQGLAAQATQATNAARERLRALRDELAQRAMRRGG
ncbi:MAG: hypothetical protein IPM99_19010 [Rubrivivax sp.]|nr:hypothetical protein [Rubrivivax sp.]